MVDLAMHMMDIAQNSLRAGATRVNIEMEENGSAQSLMLRIRDNGGGIDREAIDRLENPFYTTRTTRRIGLGIPLLKMTCEQTGGHLAIRSKKSEGTTIEALYHTDHPDCLPLGDIAGYLALLLKANPSIQFTFLYRLDETLFRLNTEELERCGIDRQQPEMVSAIREWIRNNLKTIYKKRPAHSFLSP